MQAPLARRLGSSVWGRKVARLPDAGVLLVATDLQGNLRDWERLKELYFEEEQAGNQPILALCGDLVHGPSPELNEPGAWPSYLGTEYRDESERLIQDFDTFSMQHRAFSVLGNHEHAHIGGPIVSKFFPDEAAVLEAKLGEQVPKVRSLLASFPLIAVAPCGLVLCHGAPGGSEEDLDAFEQLSYEGYQDMSVWTMHRSSTVGALLWCRSASADQAQALLEAAFGARRGGVVAYGHDIVHSGFEKVGDEQLCLSTSYGLDDGAKRYLRVDLSARYESVHDLRVGEEILALYPVA